MSETYGMTVAGEPPILTCGLPQHGMDVSDLFRTQLATIDRAIERVCRRAGLQGADAEDFASEARLALMEDDYRVLRRYRGECALATFVTVVVQNLLTDLREQNLGRFRASAAASRGGDAAVMLERIVMRDGRTIEEALPMIRNVDPSFTRAQALAILRELPERTKRPRVVELEDGHAEVVAGAERADERVMIAEQQRVSEEASRVVRETLAGLPIEDRMLVQLHYGSGMSVADVSRMLRLPQRPMYRRMESVLERLRRALHDAGLDAGSVQELIGGPKAEMDFGLEVRA